MHLARLASDRPVTTAMLLVCVVVMGFVALLCLPLLHLPVYDSPRLNLVIPYPLSAPEEPARQIVQPIEQYQWSLTTLIPYRVFGSIMPSCTLKPFPPPRRPQRGCNAHNMNRCSLLWRGVSVKATEKCAIRRPSGQKRPCYSGALRQHAIKHPFYRCSTTTCRRATLQWGA